MKKTNHYKNINKYLRAISYSNFRDYGTKYNAKIEELRRKIVYELPFCIYEHCNNYCEFLIKHILTIRNEDCYNIYIEGFKKGIQFEKESNKKSG